MTDSGKTTERNYKIHTGRPQPHWTIALVSDLHNADGRYALEILRRHHADLIAIAGDLFKGYHLEKGVVLLEEQQNILPFVRGCAELAPTYFSLGNHEWMARKRDLKVLKEAGAVVLDNCWKTAAFLPGDRDLPPCGRPGDMSPGQDIDRPVSVSPGGQPSMQDIDRPASASPGSQPTGLNDDASFPLLIGGLTSGILTDSRKSRELRAGRHCYLRNVRDEITAPPEPESAWLSDFEKKDGFKILLCHHPEYWTLQEPMLRERKIDLVLSGHAHGGQIRLFGRGLFSPGQGLLPKYSGGIHSGPNGNMVISRGLSNTAPPPIPRLFNPPEVVFIDIVT